MQERSQSRKAELIDIELVSPRKASPVTCGSRELSCSQRCREPNGISAPESSSPRFCCQPAPDGVRQRKRQHSWNQLRRHAAGKHAQPRPCPGWLGPDCSEGRSRVLRQRRCCTTNQDSRPAERCDSIRDSRLLPFFQTQLISDEVWHLRFHTYNRRLLPLLRNARMSASISTHSFCRTPVRKARIDLTRPPASLASNRVRFRRHIRSIQLRLVRGCALEEIATLTCLPSVRARPHSNASSI